MSATFGEDLPELTASAKPAGTMVPDAVLRIPVAIQVVIGSATIPLSQVAQLGPGAMISLDQKLGTPASILVNGKEVARGDLFVLDGEGDRLGITITEVSGTRGAVSL
jgi:flagellar motor switch protein FliN/FliY